MALFIFFLLSAIPILLNISLWINDFSWLRIKVSIARILGSDLAINDFFFCSSLLFSLHFPQCALMRSVFWPIHLYDQSVWPPS